MSKIFVLIYTLFFIDVYSQGLNSINSPDNANILAVGDNSKLLYSSNGGSNWISYSFGTNDFKFVTSKENLFYACGSGGTIIKSRISNINFASYSVGSFVTLTSLSFIDSSNGFACGDFGSVFRTSNGGINWTLANTGILLKKLNSISFKDISNGITVGDSGRVFITTNSGQSWSQQNSFSSENLRKVKYYSNGYMITGDNGILLLKSDTTSLMQVNLKVKSSITGLSGINLKNIHVCGGGGFIRNNLNGSSNFYNFEPNPISAYGSDIFFVDSLNGWMVNVENNAIIKTTNSGINWNFAITVNVSYTLVNKLSLPNNNAHGNTLCLHPYSPNTIFVAFNQKIFVSRNSGENWYQISNAPIEFSTDGINCLYISPVDTNIWVCLIRRTSNNFGRIARTTNYGLTWQIVFDNISIGFDAKSLEMDPNNPSVFYYIPKDSGVYKSTNNAASFARISNYDFGVTCDIYAVPDTLDLLFSNNSTNGNVTDTAEVLKSTNGGVNWTIKYRTLAAELPTITGSQFRKNNLYVADYNSSKLHTSANLGDDWNDLNVNSNGLIWALDVCREDPTFIFTSRFIGSGIYLSTNSGTNFITVADVPAVNALYAVIAPERNTLIGFFLNGIYKLKINYNVSVGISQISTYAPSQFKLNQNYPNPFNPRTIIDYEIPNANYVNIKVYDALGREMITLVDAKQNAGRYSIEFDGEEFSSGVFFYTIKTDSHTETKRMILVK